MHERSVELFLLDTAFGNDGIPRDRFESYVGELHADNNRGFSLEYPVRQASNENDLRCYFMIVS